MDELKPCPFCGGGARHFHLEEETGWSNTDWVACMESCGCSTARFDTKTDAIDAWNTRATACPFGEDCDLTTAYMVGVESRPDAAEIRAQALREAAAMIDDEAAQTWEHWGEDRNVRVAQSVAGEIQAAIRSLIDQPAKERRHD